VCISGPHIYIHTHTYIHTNEHKKQRGEERERVACLPGEQKKKERDLCLHKTKEAKRTKEYHLAFLNCMVIHTYTHTHTHTHGLNNNEKKQKR
jgi:hypothetical protein